MNAPQRLALGDVPGIRRVDVEWIHERFTLPIYDALMRANPSDVMHLDVGVRPCKGRIPTYEVYAQLSRVISDYQVVFGHSRHDLASADYSRSNVHYYLCVHHRPHQDSSDPEQMPLRCTAGVLIAIARLDLVHTINPCSFRWYAPTIGDVLVRCTKFRRLMMYSLYALHSDDVTLWSASHLTAIHLMSPVHVLDHERVALLLLRIQTLRSLVVRCVTAHVLTSMMGHITAIEQFDVAVATGLSEDQAVVLTSMLRSNTSLLRLAIRCPGANLERFSRPVCRGLYRAAASHPRLFACYLRVCDTRGWKKLTTGDTILPQSRALRLMFDDLDPLWLHQLINPTLKRNFVLWMSKVISTSMACTRPHMFYGGWREMERWRTLWLIGEYAPQYRLPIEIFSYLMDSVMLQRCLMSPISIGNDLHPVTCHLRLMQVTGESLLFD